MIKSKSYISKYWFFWAVGLAIIFKQLLVSTLPLFARDLNGGSDAWLMLTQAESISIGDWLGAYGPYTLFKKGVGFPCFLALCKWLSVPYLSGITIIHTIGSLAALKAVSGFVKNRALLFIFFVFVLFSPFSYDSYVQIVYRNGLAASLTLMTLACVMLTWQARERRASLTLSACFGFFATWTWLTRDDSYWVWVLTAGFMFIMAFDFLKSRKDWIQETEKPLWRVAVIAIPLALMILCTQAVCVLNYKYYGVYALDERQHSSFGDAYTSILKVKPEDEADYCSITHETLRRLYAVSPAMKELAPFIENVYKTNPEFISNGRNPDDGECEDGWNIFLLTDAADVLGYYSNPAVSAAFWERVHNEIEQAFKDGELEARSTFLASTMHPWRSDSQYVSRWLSGAWHLLLSTADHTWAWTSIVPANEDTAADRMAVRRYEAMTRNYTVKETQYHLDLNGWFFLTDYSELYSVCLMDENYHVVSTVDLEDFEALRDAFEASTGIRYENAAKSYFHVTLELESPEVDQLYIVAFDEASNLLARERVNPDKLGVVLQDVDAGVMYAYDVYSVHTSEDPFFSYSEAKVSLANRIASVYKTLGKLLFFISLAIYLWVSVLRILSIKKKNGYMMDEWLFLSAVLGSFVVLLIPMAYVYAFEFDTSSYMSSGGVMIELFSATSLVVSLEALFAIIRARGIRKREANASATDQHL